MSAELLDMLSYKRARGCQTELEFIDKFIAPLADHKDGYGNYMLQVGEDPKVLWSAHTDTVHHEAGRQRVMIENGMIQLAKKKVGTCLGADNGGGVWLLCEMVKARVPGLYIFHREEETGGLGSRYIAKETPQLLKGIEFAIAFDRRGYDSVITHQGGRTCSDTFANQMSGLLGGDFKPDPTGLFTDTANYEGLVSECTNISMGYFHGHGPKECLDLDFITKLRDKLVSTDFSVLQAHRDPTVIDDDWWTNYKDWPVSTSKYSHSFDFGQPYTPLRARSTYTLKHYVEDNPDLVADFLEMMGFGIDDIEEQLAL